MKFRYSFFYLSCLLLIPEIVFAHGPIKGIGNFYNGILHPIFVPAHLLLLTALGLFIGQKGIEENLSALASFASGTFIGLTLAWFSLGFEMEVYLLAGASMLGILVALELTITPVLVSLLAFFTGLFIGMDSTQETLTGTDKAVALFGTGVGLYLLQLYPMGLAEYFNKKPWQKIGIRVAGSWIAAISFLVLALNISLNAQAIAR
jgi:hydrogenase/urease accessory protein HupE